MPDAQFADPRLAVMYDRFEGERNDLTHYLSIVDELGAASVLDVGCGTGELACRVAASGLKVVGVDPAAASLALARAKPGAGGVRWIHGQVTDVPPLELDLAVMTGNVVMVFLEDDHWARTLRAIRSVLGPSGRLVFETRDPSFRAWEGWRRDGTHQSRDIPDSGSVENWIELVEVELPFVSFRSLYRFEGGEVLTSSSTLRFREAEEVATSLADAGFSVEEVRDAPDRPGEEFVFLARAANRARFHVMRQSRAQGHNG